MSDTEKSAEQIAAEKAAAKQAEKDAKAKAKADEKAAKEAAKAEAKAKKQAEAEAKKAAKPAAVVQNDVTRPSSGATAKVWELADKVSAANKKPATRKEVMEAGLAEGLVAGTINTQFGKWRKFHGLAAEPKEVKAKPAADAGTAAPAAQ